MKTGDANMSAEERLENFCTLDLRDSTIDPWIKGDSCRLISA